MIRKAVIGPSVWECASGEAMKNPFKNVFAIWVLCCPVLGLMGCGTAPGGALALFPDSHRLLKVTKQIRDTAPVPAPVPRELQKTVVPLYIIEPGDVLLVEPLALDSPLRFPADQTVLVDGTIDLGQFGRLHVAGQSIEQIEEQVEIAIRSADVQFDGEPLTPEQSEVNVRLMASNAAMYYVLGEVNSPGDYSLIGRETVLDAILTAGGLSDRASKHKILLTRVSHPGECRTVLPVCWNQIVQLGDSTTNYQIMPGDRIFVATEGCFDGICRACNIRKCDPCERCQCTTGSGPPSTPPPTAYSLPLSGPTPATVSVPNAPEPVEAPSPK